MIWWGKRAVLLWKNRKLGKEAEEETEVRLRKMKCWWSYDCFVNCSSWRPECGLFVVR